MAKPLKPLRKPKKMKTPKRRKLKAKGGGTGPVKVATAAPLPADPHKVRLAEQARREKIAANWKPSPLLAHRGTGNTAPAVALLRDYRVRGKKASSRGSYYVLIFAEDKLVDVLAIPDVYEREDGQPSIRLKKKLYPLLSTAEYLYASLSGPFVKAASPSLQIYPEAWGVPGSTESMVRLSDIDGSFVSENAQALLQKLRDAQQSKKAVGKPVASSDTTRDRVGALIAALPKRNLTELRQMWLNAIHKMESQRPYPKQSIEKLLKAIEDEWHRRGAIGIVDSDDYFKWPTTEANPSKSSLGEFEAPGQGVLGYLEYHVGKTHGLSMKARRAILERVFAGKLPPVFDKKYLQQWGEPATAKRLQKMAECIAAFTRNFKRRDDDKLDQAIREWEADLLFLFEQYYVGKFRFAWPTTRVS